MFCLIVSTKLYLTGLSSSYSKTNLWLGNPGAARSCFASADLSSFHPSNCLLFFNVITLCKRSVVGWLSYFLAADFNAFWILLCMSRSTESWGSCKCEYNPFRPVWLKTAVLGSFRQECEIIQCNTLDYQCIQVHKDLKWSKVHQSFMININL